MCAVCLDTQSSLNEIKAVFPKPSTFLWSLLDCDLRQVQSVNLCITKESCKGCRTPLRALLVAEACWVHHRPG